MLFQENDIIAKLNYNRATQSNTDDNSPYNIYPKTEDTVPTNYFDSQINRGFGGQEDYARHKTIIQSYHDLDFQVSEANRQHRRA